MEDIIKVEITTLDIRDLTGIPHNKVMRDMRDKYIKHYPLDNDNISLSMIGQSDFVVKLSSYTNERGKTYDCFVLNKNAANAFMANYKLEYAMKVIDHINVLEKELLAKQEELDIMKNIVWTVINGQNYVNQNQALKMAGVKHPNLFMKYLKDNTKFHNNLVYERHYLVNKQVGKSGLDRCWRFTQEGFRWLIDNRNKVNDWVNKQKDARKSFI